MKNNVELEGTLTKDIEVHMTKNNKLYCKFSLCCEDGNWKNYISCIAWEENANCLSGLKKGETISFIGSIKTGSYEGKNGKVYTTDVLVKEFANNKEADKVLGVESSSKTKELVKTEDINELFGL